MGTECLDYINLQRDIPMLLGRVFVPLGFQHLQRLDQLLARFSRLDDGIDVAALGGDVRVGKRSRNSTIFFCRVSSRFSARSNSLL